MLTLSVVNEFLDIQVFRPMLEYSINEACDKWSEFRVVVFESENYSLNSVCS